MRGLTDAQCTVVDLLALHRRTLRRKDIHGCPTNRSQIMRELLGLGKRGEIKHEIQGVVGDCGDLARRSSGFRSMTCIAPRVLRKASCFKEAVLIIMGRSRIV